MVFISLPWLKFLLGLGIAAALYFIFVSVIASYFVYDHSDLYQLKWWPDRVIPSGAQNATLVHAGFDPASRKLTRKYPGLTWSIMDFFNPATTTETSIRTARKLFPPLEGEHRIKANQWPLPDFSQDIVFIISAAHEIRDSVERRAFFAEARRVLSLTGRVVVIEQLRDFTNFATFGAAVFHFLSYRTWQASFRAGHLTKVDEFRISPWMKAFVLSR